MLSSDGEDEDVEAVQKMKTLYQSCLDTDTIDGLGAKPLIELIQITGEAGRRRQHYIHRAVCMASIINLLSGTGQYCTNTITTVWNFCFKPSGFDGIC